jgi:hypothetical protein
MVTDKVQDKEMKKLLMFIVPEVFRRSSRRIELLAQLEKYLNFF